MSAPEVEIQPEDSLEDAVSKVVAAYEALGAKPLAFEQLNTLLPTSSFCQFFQMELGALRYIAVINSRPWDESSVLDVLNILLNVRMDPDPSASPPRFRFYGAHPVAPVLVTLFGDDASSDYESRAAVVVGYGRDLRPSQSYQLAAVAVHLLRECFGVRASLLDSAAVDIVAEVLSTRFSASRFPEGGAPLNALVTLGFLYGELVRLRLPYVSRWVSLRDQSPWPVLVFGPELGGGPEPDDAGAEHGVPQIVFNPLATVVGVYQGNPLASILESVDALGERCEDVLGVPDEN